MEVFHATQVDGRKEEGAGKGFREWICDAQVRIWRLGI